MTSHQQLSSTDILARLAGISSYTPAPPSLVEETTPIQELLESMFELDRILTEERLNFSQIDDIFKKVIDGLEAKTADDKHDLSNRTLAGKAKDITAKITNVIMSNTWKKVKGWESDHGPVEKAFNEIKDEIKSEEDRKQLQDSFESFKSTGVKFVFAQGMIWDVIGSIVRLVKDGGKSKTSVEVAKTAMALLDGKAFQKNVINGMFKSGTVKLFQALAPEIEEHYRDKQLQVWIEKHPEIADGIDKNINTIATQMNDDKIPDICRVLLVTCSHPKDELVVKSGTSSFGVAKKYAISKNKNKSPSIPYFIWNGGYYNYKNDRQRSGIFSGILNVIQQHIEIDLGLKTNKELIQMTEEIDTLNKGEDMLLETLLLEDAYKKLATQFKSIGKNLTSKVSLQKLNKAWYDAGSPRHPAKFEDFLVKFLNGIFGKGDFSSAIGDIVQAAMSSESSDEKEETKPEKKEEEIPSDSKPAKTEEEPAIEKTDDTPKEEASKEKPKEKVNFSEKDFSNFVRIFNTYTKEKKFPPANFFEEPSHQLYLSRILKAAATDPQIKKQIRSLKLETISVESLEKAILIEQQCKLAGIQSSFNSTVFFEQLDKFLNQAEVALINMK